jgi:hypothetical protein
MWFDRTAKPALRRCTFAALLSAAALFSSALADDALKGRPALAEAEVPAERAAECGELRSMLRDLPELDRRIDLWVAGDALAVQTDGALWYLVLCAAPDISVLCVTYEDNGMKKGDRIIVRGAYSRRDDDHVMLDPCLASPP